MELKIDFVSLVSHTDAARGSVGKGHHIWLRHRSVGNKSCIPLKVPSREDKSHDRLFKHRVDLEVRSFFHGWWAHYSVLPPHYDFFSTVSGKQSDLPELGVLRVKLSAVRDLASNWHTLFVISDATKEWTTMREICNNPCFKICGIFAYSSL